jgi:hypothetical protein
MRADKHMQILPDPQTRVILLITPALKEACIESKILPLKSFFLIIIGYGNIKDWR